MKRFVLLYLIIFLMTSLCTLMTLERFSFPIIGVDDANIFFVYGKNLANCNGFVYNEGGERVEGFTSILWVLICALAFRFFSYPERMLLIVNIFLISLGITIGGLYIKSVFHERSVLKIPFSNYIYLFSFLILVFSMPIYFVWSTITLMDNALWSTLLLITTIIVIQDTLSVRFTNRLFILLSFLLILTRPEAFLWVPVFILALFIRRYFSHNLHNSLTSLAIPFSAYLFFIISLTAFRIKYFGFPLPNTYYAKISPSFIYNIIEGLKYFSSYLTSEMINTACILSVAVLTIYSVYSIVKKGTIENSLMILPLITLTGLAIPVIVGGDHFQGFRFYQNIYPILIICLIYTVVSVLPKFFVLKIRPGSKRYLAISFICIFIITFFVLRIFAWKRITDSYNMGLEFEIADKGRERGEFMSSFFSTLQRLPSIGVVVAGGTKYTYLGEIVDLMGLNNLKMAHNKGTRQGLKNHAAFEKETFYELMPDALSIEIINTDSWCYNKKAVESSFVNRVLKRLFNDERFKELYAYARLRRKDTNDGKAMLGFFNKGFVNHISKMDEFVVETYD